jgi:hypothetical protein
MMVVPGERDKGDRDTTQPCGRTGGWNIRFMESYAKCRVQHLHMILLPSRGLYSYLCVHDVPPAFAYILVCDHLVNFSDLKGLSHEIDFKNVDKNFQN